MATSLFNRVENNVNIILFFEHRIYLHNINNIPHNISIVFFYNTNTR